MEIGRPGQRHRDRGWRVTRLRCRSAVLFVAPFEYECPNGSWGDQHGYGAGAFGEVPGTAVGDRYRQLRARRVEELDDWVALELAGLRRAVDDGDDQITDTHLSGEGAAGDRSGARPWAG